MPEQAPQPESLDPNELADLALAAIGDTTFEPGDQAAVQGLNDRADAVLHEVVNSPNLAAALDLRARQLDEAQQESGTLTEDQQRQQKALWALQNRAQFMSQREESQGAQSTEDDAASGSDKADDGAREAAPRPGPNTDTERAQHGYGSRKAAARAAGRHSMGDPSGADSPDDGSRSRSPREEDAPKDGDESEPETESLSDEAAAALGRLEAAFSGISEEKKEAGEVTDDGGDGDSGKGGGVPAEVPSGEPEEHKRGGEIIPNTVEGLQKIKRMLQVGMYSAGSFLTLHDAIRRSTVRGEDGNWGHVASITWTRDEAGKWKSTPDEVGPFVQAARNGKRWNYEDVNALVGEIIELSDPNNALIRSDQERQRVEEIMEKKFLSPAHTDHDREVEKARWLGADYEEPVGEGWLEWERDAIRDKDATKDEVKVAAQRAVLDIAARLRSEDPSLDEKSALEQAAPLAEQEAEQAARNGFLRRLDFDKVQAAVRDKIRDIPAFAGNLDRNAAILDRTLAMVGEDRRKEILEKIVGGGSSDEDKQQLNDLLNTALGRGHARAGATDKLWGTKGKSRDTQLFTDLMGQFDKTRDTVWRKNSNSAIRDSMYARYQELTGESVVLSWAPQKSWAENFQLVKRGDYIPEQMETVLATIKLDTLARATVNDELLELKRRGGYDEDSALATLDTSGARQFNGLEPVTSSRLLFARMNYGRNSAGYHNPYLDYLYALSTDEATRGDWLLRERREEGSYGDDESTKRRVRFRRAHEDLKDAASERLKMYDDMWMSSSTPRTTPAWFVRRIPVPMPAPAASGRGGGRGHRS